MDDRGRLAQSVTRPLTPRSRPAAASRGWFSRASRRLTLPLAHLHLPRFAGTALFLSFLGIRIGAASSDSLAKNGPAYDALKTLRSGGVSTGVLTPMEVLVRTDVADQIKSPADWKGRKLGVTGIGSSTYFLTAASIFSGSMSPDTENTMLFGWYAIL